MKQAEIRKENQSIEARVRLGLKLREQGEQMIADALQEKLDAAGEEAWLFWCKEEFGWGRSAAYRHLNPESLKADREAASQRRDSRDAAPRQDEQPEAEASCKMPSQEHDVAMAVMQLNSILREGGFTPKRLKEQVIGNGKWKILEEVKRLIVVLTKLQKELENT